MDLKNYLRNPMAAYLYTQIFSKLDDVLEDQISKSELAVLLVKNINDGATLEDLVKTYVQFTDNVSDDRVFEIVEEILSKVEEVLEAIAERPIKEVIKQYLGEIEIPDLDDNPDNNVSVGVVLLDIIEDVATGQSGDEPI